MPSEEYRDSEAARLAALRALEVLDSAPEAQFDALVRTAAYITGTPISLISLIDSERQWFKANFGLGGATETPRDIAFCAHAIEHDELFEIADATQDARFANNPLVTGQPDIRFYAGAPLRLSSGFRIGTLCVIDRTPRRLTPEQKDLLMQLATAAARALEARSAARLQREALERSAIAERALMEERRRLAAIIEGTGAGTWEWNTQTGECRINAQWAQIIGYSPGEIGADPRRMWLDHIHPDDLARFEKFLNRHLASEISYEFESRMRHRDGRWLWVLDRGMVQSSTPDGRPEWISGIHLDITARKQQEEALRKSQRFLERSGEVAGVGGWELEVATRAVVWSDQTCRIYGVEPGYQPSLDEAISFYAPEARRLIQDAVEDAITDGKGWDLEVPFLRINGERIWVRAVGAVEFENGSAIRLVGTFQDITESRRIKAELAEQHELLRVTMRSIGDSVITTDRIGRVDWMNPVAERMTGWSAQEAKGKQLMQVFRIFDAETRLPADNPVAYCLNYGKIAGLADHTILVSRHGEEFGIEESASPIRDDSGQVLGVVLVFHDVTEQRRTSGEMSHRVKHDPITGLLNRTEFESRLRIMMRKTHQAGGESALLYVDLDQFKLVNDTCGHAIGDQLLQQVGKVFTETVRAGDTLARLGSDEFAILLENCSLERGQYIAQKICDRMDQFRFTHDSRRFRIGASIGLVVVDGRWTKSAEILHAGDSAAYSAKHAGRNRVHIWSDTDLAMRARADEMHWAARIEQALEDDRFVLYAQRIDAVRRALSGIHAEVLLRMLAADGSIIMPGAFLPATERFHLAARVDRWVLHKSVSWLQTLEDLSAIEMLSVNLSGQSIGDRSFHKEAVHILSAAGPEICKRICLEITETAAISNLNDANMFIEQVRDLGIRIALDDFGAGFSSFGYLKTLNVDYLKVDGQFIKGIVNDPVDEATVRCFVDVAKVLGIETVAEFVESPEIVAKLDEIGIDFLQGYWVHRPAPIETLLTKTLASAPRAANS